MPQNPLNVREKGMEKMKKMVENSRWNRRLDKKIIFQLDSIKSKTAQKKTNGVCAMKISSF